ncbi:hypothetical protein GQ43DRAFT_496926 [Delitschia confertaspora ATCC 74209]|uniref:Peptidase S54 rhomboid domain-containing protein n=1 Tax=Delitschia confertaspora ATCC 74209 TaxID=1513339 RepID=A0A9P4JRC1_9PLEO|nr:hypothetical protein GQ43DRAFT_496926 [Delitschia confertaspora ATCC 74209]
MISSGFDNAPISRFLVFSTVLSALLISITDTKPYLPLAVVPHIWHYGQFWRCLTWWVGFTNSTEVLFAALGFYGLRVVERVWGGRKFGSFIIATLPYTVLLPPLLLIFVLRPLSFNRINYLPAGPTTILFALLAQYYAAIPYTYRYSITPVTASPSSSSTSSSPPSSMPSWNKTLTLTSKSLSYIPFLQLALSQLPGSLIGALVGWAVGTAYRRDMLPGVSSWRVPAWIVGEKEPSGDAGFQGLMQRLDAESERDGGLASGILAREGVGNGEGERRRRTLGELVGLQFRGRG